MSLTIRAALLGSALMLLCLTVSAQDTRQQSFVSGGRVKIILKAGDYKIQPSPDNTLRITWYGDSVERSKVRITIRTLDKTAEITVKDTPNHDFHAIIELPAKTDVFVRLSAGNLAVAGIAGSKDIESRAGDLEIDVGDPGDYLRVDASVVAGDLNAPAFKVSKGGIFRSFRQTGNGIYTLHAHLLAGDLTLRSARSLRGD